MILSSVSITLLLLRNNLIFFHQSSNFDQLLSNFFGNSAYMLFIAVSGAGATDISSIVVCSYLSEASSVICKDPNRSDNASISFVLLELVLVLSS